MMTIAPLHLEVAVAPLRERPPHRRAAAAAGWVPVAHRTPQTADRSRLSAAAADRRSWAEWAGSAASEVRKPVRVAVAWAATAPRPARLRRRWPAAASPA